MRIQNWLFQKSSLIASTYCMTTLGRLGLITTLLQAQVRCSDGLVLSVV